MAHFFLVVKTVMPTNQPFAGASATFNGTSCTTTPQPGVLELQLPAGTTGGTVAATAPVGTAAGAWTDSQTVTIDLTGKTPTIAFNGHQSIHAVRVAVTSRGADFSLEVHFVVDAAFRLAMDGFFASFGGPYRVSGVAVNASPHFRMGGENAFALDNGRLKDLDQVAAAAGVAGDVGVMHSGRPLPDQIRRVVQSLIDALMARSSIGYNLSATNGIRRMMFDYGIGIDCAGYVQQSFLASRRKARAAYGLKTLDMEDLSALPSSTFRKVDVKRARSGDMIVLDKPTTERGEVGHTVIVYSHVVEPTEVLLAQLHGADAQALTQGGSNGPAHLYYLDASWGGGTSGNPAGGVQRKPWSYNEATGQWGWIPVGVSTAAFRLDRPYDHPYVGTFRPREELP